MELFRLVGEVALNGTDTVKNELDDISSKGEDSENRLVSSFKKIGTAVMTYFAVDKIISFGQELATTSATVAAENSAFAQIMGDYSNAARDKMKQVADETGVLASRLTPYMTSMTAKFKGLGYGVEDATSYAVDGLMLASDAAAFWDRSLDDTMSHLNSFINGSYEGGEAIGLFANDTQMAAYAIKQGLVEDTKEWRNLDEATKQATRLEYAQAMMEASGAIGQARKEAGQYANQSADLTEKWRQFKAEIGEPILQNIVVPIMVKLSEIVDKLSVGYQDLKEKIKEAKEWLEENKDTVETTIGVVEVLTATFIGLKAGMAIQSAVQGFQKAKVAISLLSLETGKANLAQLALNGTMTAWQTIVALLTGKMTLAQLATGLWTKAQTALNVVLTANPIGLIIAAITAVIAIIVVLWNKCDWFREGVTNIFNAIVDVVKVGIEKVKGFFTAIIDFVKNNWKSLLLLLVNPFAGAFKLLYDNCEGFRNIVNNVVSAVKGFFVDLWTKIKEVFNGIVNAISIAVQFIGSIFNLLIDIILIPWNFIWVNFGTYIMAAINAAKQWLLDLWATISGFFTNLWTTISNFFIGIWTTITTWLSSIWASFTTWLTEIWVGISTWFTEKWTIFTTWLTGIWTAISEFFVGIWTAIVDWFTQIWNSIVEKVTAIKDSVTSAFNAVKDAISNAINAAKNKVVTVFNNIKNSISEKINAVKTNVTNTFNKIKTAITTPIERARDVIKGIIDKIKGFFKFEVELPKIKLPHFSVTPKGWQIGDLMKGSVPKLGIEWYAKAMDKGMILDEPTIFGINSNGIPMGAGEAGSETVVGTNSLMNMIDKAVKSNTPQVDNSGVEQKLDKLIKLMTDLKIELDEEVVGKFVVRTVEKEVFN